MQIGPSLSVLQALGSHPGAPEPARMKAAAQVAATADVQRAAETARPEAGLVDTGINRAGPVEAVAGLDATAPGRRLDILA